MVQLSDDSVHGAMLDLDTAVARLIELAQNTIALGQGVQVDLSAANDRILAADIAAASPVPRVANSAVDGFAFCYADLTSSANRTWFSLAPKAIYAGAQDAQPLASGTAIAITTGAEIPGRADTVCMLEDALSPSAADYLADSDNPAGDGDKVVGIPAALKLGSNLRPQGEDFQRGAVVAQQGCRLTARALAAISATSALDCVEVYRPLRILIASTGDEVGHGPNDQVPDTNGPMLERLFGDSWRFEVSRHSGVLPDDLAALTAFFKRATSSADVVLTSGGVSTGQKDLLKQAFGQAGGQVDFWRIGIKPGRPVAVGTLGTSLWIGLPGNPVAALVTALEVALPTLRAANGEALRDQHVTGFWAAMGDSYKKKPHRREFVRVKLEVGSKANPDKQDLAAPLVRKFHKSGAGMISGLLWADGLAVIDDDSTDIGVGTPVWFKPWSSYRL